LSTWLGEIRTWLDSNPSEVVTVLLVNSDNASASDIAAQYAAAGIEHYAYHPDSQTKAPGEWPTLQTLINNGTRLLNFVASLEPASNTAAPYLMDEFTFMFENNYENTAPSDYSCTANRPSSVNGQTAAALSANMMPLMNHFLYNTTNLLGTTIDVPDSDYANVTNAPSGGVGNLGDAAAECSNAYGRAPTYVLVDFFNEGPAIESVDRLNGVTAAVGRTGLSTISSGSGSSAMTSDASLGRTRGLSLCMQATVFCALALAILLNT